MGQCPTSDAALMDVSVRQRIVKKLAERVGFRVMVWMSLLGVVSELPRCHSFQPAVALLTANKTAPVRFSGAA
jgi:hypothetical protein